MALGRNLGDTQLSLQKHWSLSMSSKLPSVKTRGCTDRRSLRQSNGADLLLQAILNSLYSYEGHWL
jgi:hypothetical protein